MGLYKMCSKCKRVTIKFEDKYCDKCQAVVDEQNKKRLEKISHNKTYKYNKQKKYMKKVDDFYNTKEWKRVRDNIKIHFKGVCSLCLLRDGVVQASDVVHHVIEVRNDWSKRLDRDNLICLCYKCHNKVHDIYDKSGKQKELMQNELRNIIKEFDAKYNKTEELVED